MTRFFPSRTSRKSRGFTLVEMMVAMSVFVLLLVIVFQITKAVTSLWKDSAGKISAFTQARGAYEAVTRTISQATLNPYIDYTDSAGDFRNPGSPAGFVPVRYGRRSDLHFLSGKGLLGGTSVPHPITHAIFFQAPMGYTRATSPYRDMSGSLNACGFFIYYGEELTRPSFLPASVKSPNRFRLMQFLQPTENLSIYDDSITGGMANWDSHKWFTDPLSADIGSSAPASLSQLAENVVALFILPKNSRADDRAGGTPLTTDYEFDSRNKSDLQSYNQVPPVIQVVMAVIDEKSAILLGDSATPPDLTAGIGNDPTRLNDDLAVLEKNLSAAPGNPAGNTKPLRFEIFTTEISLPAAKWSAN